MNTKALIKTFITFFACCGLAVIILLLCLEYRQKNFVAVFSVLVCLFVVILELLYLIVSFCFPCRKKKLIDSNKKIWRQIKVIQIFFVGVAYIILTILKYLTSLKVNIADASPLVTMFLAIVIVLGMHSIRNTHKQG